MAVKILPRKMSALIDLALADLELAEKSKDYVIDMGEWHRAPSSDPYDDDNLCSVCLAGSVMAFSLKANKVKTYEPEFIPESMGDNTDQLLAINCLRTGSVQEASEILGLDNEEEDGPFSTDFGWFDRDVIDYEDNRAGFKRDMKKLSADLKKYGF